jgi:hypothetical protein
VRTGSTGARCSAPLFLRLPATTLALLAAGPAWAKRVPYVLDLDLTTAFTTIRNEPETNLHQDDSGVWQVGDLLHPRDPETYPSAGLRLGAEAQPARWLELRGLLDTGPIRPGSSLDPPEDGATSYGLPLDEAASEGLFLREAAVGFVGQWGSVELGRRRSEVASGLVYDDYGTGGAVDLDVLELERGPLQVKMLGLLVGRTFSDMETGSSLFALRVDYPLSLFESVGPFFAYWADRGGAVGDILASARREAIIVENGPVVEQVLLTRAARSTQRPDADVFYAGFGGSVVPVLNLSLRGDGVAEFGSATVRLGAEETALDFRGWAGDIEAHRGLTERWDLGAFAFGLSGDRAPRVRQGDTTYAGFVAPAPYWTWTGLFFSGGLNQGFYPSRASAAGINGHGVLGLGPILSWRGDRPSFETRVAWLRALSEAPPAPLGGGGSQYGVELDLRNDWRLGNGVTLAGELDVLFPGSYFPEHDPALRFIVLLDLHYGS